MDRSHISKQQEEMLDEIFNADMSLMQVRQWKKDRESGHNLNPSDWMKEQELPEEERTAIKAKRIEYANDRAEFQEFLDERFPGRSKAVTPPESERDYFQEFMNERFPNRNK